MTSFLIIGTPDTSLEALLHKNAIDPIDVSSLDKQDAVIGIEDIRQLQAQMALRPIKSPNKAAVIKNSQLLTIPAQNALLKTLEEPPENTLIILLSKSLDALLPTIRSRCQIIEVTGNKTAHDLTDAEAFLFRLAKEGIGERLFEAEQIAKNKQTILIRMETLLEALSQELLANTPSRKRQIFAQAAAVFQETYRILSHTNTNPRLALEHCFLTAFALP